MADLPGLGVASRRNQTDTVYKTREADCGAEVVRAKGRGEERLIKINA